MLRAVAEREPYRGMTDGAAAVYLVGHSRGGKLSALAAGARQTTAHGRAAATALSA